MVIENSRDFLQKHKKKILLGNFIFNNQKNRGRDPMTICIAAIASSEDGHESIVFATDHMVTMGPLGQFEHTINKYRLIRNNAIVMLAGNPLFLNEFTELPDSVSSYDEIKNFILGKMRAKRKEIIENEILDMYGINYEFIKEMMGKEIPNLYVDEILKKITQFKLGTTVLLAGFNNNEAMITQISDENYADFRDINFNAIGSGNIQALNTLLFQKHSKRDSITTAVFNVYKAKRNAEVAQGVGKETDMGILLKKDACVILTEAQLNLLGEIYEDELKLGRNHEKLNNLKDHRELKLSCL